MKLTKLDLLNLKNSTESKVIRTLIGTIIGELDRLTKDPSETQIISVIKKLYEADKQCTQTPGIIEEMEFLSSYIPKVLSNEGMLKIVSELEFKSIGEYMKYFKENYPNQYDGSALKDIVLSHLKNGK